MTAEHLEDEDILDRIDELTKEEDELHGRAQEDDGLSADDAALLHSVQVERDQQWDLLRQRRAKRDAGLDPDEAQLRDGQTVESYEQ